MSSKHICGQVFVLVLILLWGISGTAKAEMKIYDARNQFLGILVDGGPVVYVPSMDMMVEFETDETLSPKGKYANVEAAGNFYYQLPGCSGIAYVYVADFPAKIIRRKGGTNNYYVVNINSTSVSTPISYLNYFGNCYEGPGPEGTAYYASTSSVTLPFTTPIELPYRLESIGSSSQTKVVVIPMGSNSAD